MGKLVFGMMQSLDGTLAGRLASRSRPKLARHFLDHVSGLAGMV
jgi:hypothetical protein